MKNYKVAVTETYSTTVSVKAENENEALQQVRDSWNNTEIILDLDNFDKAEMRVIGEDTEVCADRFYIAYGSNFYVPQMKYRTRINAEIFGVGVLEGWQLLFRKYATIKRNDSYKTPVLIWKISADGEKRLDRYEGFPRSYGKETLQVAVTSLNGEFLGEVNAMVYTMTPETEREREADPVPSEDYYFLLHEGYERFGFDKNILRNALQESIEFERRNTGAIE